MDRIVVEYLANALWQIPLLAAGVGGLLWALGADVQTRHRAWLAVLALAVLMPLRGMELPHGAAPAPAVSASISSWTAAVPPTEIMRAAPPPAAERHTPMLVFGEVSYRWVVRIYMAALLFAGWRILHAWIAAQGLLRRSHSIHLAPRALAIFAQAAERQQIRLPRLRQSEETVSPVVIGAWRPVLLLPAGFDRLKDDEILAALSHEFAHLARRDYLVNLICQIAALPISWHPATHLVQKRIRDTREMLCDAVAAEEMASPVRYAACLVAFAFRALDNRKGALATQGMTMFDNSTLEERILQLTQELARPEPRARRARLAGASFGLALSVAGALLFHVTPTLADTTDPVEATQPVQLTPPVELPAMPVPPAEPVAPVKPVTPAKPDQPSVTIHHHATSGSDEIQRGIEEEKRQQAQRQRDEAQRQRDAAQAQREEAQAQREMARQQREQAQVKAERERELAQDKAERERDAAEAQREAARDIAEAQREAAREAEQDAREAAEEARRQADEIRRQVAEAVKANEIARNIDMEAIRRQVAEATAKVNGPEFKAQMAELQTHMKELHDHMAELRDHMKEINKEMEKSFKAPM